MSRWAEIATVIAAVLVTAACRHDKGAPPAPADVLVAVGDSVLCESDVLARLPLALDPGDSAAMFGNIVQAWVEEQLLLQTAADNIDDFEAIERKVELYRRRLVVESYLRRVRENGRKGVAERHVRDYYRNHAAEMLCERPLVRGVLLRVSASEPELPRLRGWMASARPADIDNIERHGLGSALQYDYFIDRWVDWSEVARQIPYRFYDPEAFLESTTDFETECDGWVYLLHISSFLPAGTVMPYDFARAQIVEMLEDKDMRGAERRLLQRLFNQAADNGVLRAVGYDPVTHRRL